MLRVQARVLGVVRGYIPLESVRDEANKWAHFTMAAYTRRWNENATSVLDALKYALKAGWDLGWSDPKVVAPTVWQGV